MAAAAAVSTSGLTKAYSETAGIFDVDLEVPGGTVMALLGPNGAGKTTALRVLSTLLRPDHGTVRVGGFDALTQPDRVRALIGVANQASAIDEKLSGRVNLNMFARLHRLSWQTTRQRTAELLDRASRRRAAGRPMSAALAERPPSRWWVLSDYFEMGKRSLRHIGGDPDQLVTVTLQPVLTLTIMNFFIGGAIKTGTRQDYLDFVLPGIFIVMAGFAAVTTALGVASDMQQGVVDRFRTLPMAKSAVIAGHVISDLPRALIGLAVTIGFGLLIGFRSPAGAGAWAAAIGITLLATFALSWIAAVIGLLGSSVEVVQQVAAIIIIPVFLSSALVPTDTMPAWLRVVTENQPLSQAIDCIRALLTGTPLGDHLGLALAELTGIIVVAFALAITAFKRKTSQ